VRSRAQLDYVGVQAAADRGDLPDAVRLLPEVGRLREQRSRERHAIDLDLPEQVVAQNGGRWTLALRQPLAIENHNAQISLLVGACAAQLMLNARIGIVRTVPAPDAGAVASLRRAALALGVDWPEGAQPGDVLAGLRRDDPKHFALLEHAATLLRGAGYVDFAGTVPQHPEHAGIGSPYAHVTAPLRRLVDRYGTEVCLAVAAGRPVPTWVTEALPRLPEEMRRADTLAHTVDRAVVDATEAWLLEGRVGETFEVLVIDADEHAGTVVLDEPAVRARCDGTGLPVGERIAARLATADPATRQVRFEAAVPQL
jgi:exoribonuclease R